LGTRGLVTFVTTDGVIKSAYNQYDSYPSGVGKDVLSFVRKATTTENIKAVTRLIDNLTVVSQKVEPTAQQISELSMFADTKVSTGELSEWYVLLRRTQGNPAMILYSGHVEDMTDFGKDSLFCEWAYAINMQDNTFEVYQGFQRETPKHGIWAGLGQTKDTGYAGVERIGVWSLSSLPTDEEFFAVCQAAEDLRV